MLPVGLLCMPLRCAGCERLPQRPAHLPGRDAAVQQLQVLQAQHTRAKLGVQGSMQVADKPTELCCRRLWLDPAAATMRAVLLLQLLLLLAPALDLDSELHVKRTGGPNLPLRSRTGRHWRLAERQQQHTLRPKQPRQALTQLLLQAVGTVSVAAAAGASTGFGKAVKDAAAAGQ